MSRLLLGVAGVVALAALTGCQSQEPKSGVLAKPQETKLKKAYSDCDVPYGSKIELGDGNSSILMSGVQGEDFGTVACIMLGLDTPQYVVQEVDATTAMMGRQHEEAGGISYDWSYHPDNGLNMTMHEGD